MALSEPTKDKWRRPLAFLAWVDMARAWRSLPLDSNAYLGRPRNHLIRIGCLIQVLMPSGIERQPIGYTWK